MLFLLTVGSSKFLLPETANVNLIIRELGKAQPVEYHDYHVFPPLYRKCKAREEVKVELINADRIIPEKKTLAIPSKASPDCHDKDFFKSDFTKE